MTLSNVWVVSDGYGNYFEGCRTSLSSGFPVSVFAPLSSRTRTYKNQKSVTSAVRMAASFYESPNIRAEFIESAEASDIPD